MDLYIEKDTIKTRLSSLGILVQDIKVSNAVVEANRTRISGKNGNLFTGATHTEKSITVVGKYYVQDELQDELKKDQLNGLLADTTPFYITRMYQSGSLYDFERPGEKKGFDLIQQDKQRKYHYRYKVLLNGEIDYSFQGFSDAGLLYEISITFVTSDIPYGVTVPLSIELPTPSGFIPYKGTTPCSQLEWPWIVEVTATASSTVDSFDFTIGDRTFTYEGTKNIASGDVFSLEGTAYTLNGLNINDQTNIEYFVLNHSLGGAVSYSTTLTNVTIRLINKVDFYR